jgi:hypothetical protein
VAPGTRYGHTNLIEAIICSDRITGEIDGPLEGNPYDRYYTYIWGYMVDANHYEITKLRYPNPNPRDPRRWLEADGSGITIELH